MKEPQPARETNVANASPVMPKQEGPSENSPQRWGIRLAIGDDLRFLSHHDTMRAVERTATRAKLPLRYTRGYNPHPVLSLPCPRPVGAASRDDLLVLSLDAPLVGGAGELLSRLNASAPHGMQFLRACPLPAGRAPRPCRAAFELPVGADRLEALRKRLIELRRLESWPVERLVSAGRRRDGMKPRTIDLRPLVEDVRIEGDVLRWTLAPRGDLWARPGELLGLLGLDERADLAAATRTEVTFRGDAASATGDEARP